MNSFVTPEELSSVTGSFAYIARIPASMIIQRQSAFWYINVALRVRKRLGQFRQTALRPRLIVVYIDSPWRETSLGQDGDMSGILAGVGSGTPGRKTSSHIYNTQLVIWVFGS